jgi:hypothetical protein
MHIGEDSLLFLARFARSPDGRALVETILKPLLAESDAKLRTASGEEVYRFQGEARRVDELIKLITEAQQKLTRKQAPLGKEYRLPAQ